RAKRQRRDDQDGQEPVQRDERRMIARDVMFGDLMFGDSMFGDLPHERLPHRHARAARSIGAKKLIRLPSGSRNSIERLPHGWLVGSSSNFPTRLASRARSRSTSSTSKSRMTDRLAAGAVTFMPCRSMARWLTIARPLVGVANSTYSSLPAGEKPGAERKEDRTPGAAGGGE